MEEDQKRRAQIYDMEIDDAMMIPDSMTHVYTDGSCRGNGAIDAIGGIGVWFADRDKRNVSKTHSGKSPGINLAAAGKVWHWPAKSASVNHCRHHLALPVKNSASNGVTCG